MAGRAADASSTASPLSAREGEKWRGVRRGVAGSVDCPVGSALELPSPPGGEGSMTAGGLGVHSFFRRGGLLTTRVSSELAISSELAKKTGKNLSLSLNNHVVFRLKLILGWSKNLWPKFREIGNFV